MSFESAVEAGVDGLETFLSKLKLQFQRSATENVLMSNQLNSPEHLKLTGQPARLIVILYEHSSVEQRFRGSAGQTHPGEPSTMTRPTTCRPTLIAIWLHVPVWRAKWSYRITLLMICTIVLLEQNGSRLFSD